MDLGNGFRLRPTKITGKEFLDGPCPEPVFNVLKHFPGYKKADKVWFQKMDECHFNPMTKDTLAHWGKPNIVMRQHESYPGVWILTDTITGIVWHIWSDKHHKRPWKGTSYELLVPDGTTDDQMVSSIERFFACLITGKE